MFLWIVLLGIYGLLAVLDVCNGFHRLNRKLLTGILIFPMFFLVAFRANYVGPDTYSYSFLYERIARYDSWIDALADSRMENGFVLLEYFCSSVGLSYQFFQVLISGFIYYSFYRFIHKYSQLVAVSCFLVYANSFMFGTMNVVRMWIAVAVLLYAIESLLNDRFKRFLIIVMVASCFHVSALCFFIVYPLKNVKWSMKKVSIIFAGAISVTIFAYPIFKMLFSFIGRYENYLSRFEESNLLATRLELLVEIFFFVFIMIVYKQYISRNCSSRRMINLLYTLHIILVCISIVGLSNNIMGRVSYYFSTYSLISIPFGISMIKRAKWRFIFSCILIFCLSAQFLVILSYRPEWYQVVPYGFVD